MMSNCPLLRKVLIITCFLFSADSAEKNADFKELPKIG